MEVLSRDESVEGGKTCKRKLTNQIQTRGLSGRLREIRTGLVGANIKSEQICSKSLNSKIQISTSKIGMDRSMRKWQKFLKQHPKLNSSSDEIEELPPECITGSRYERDKINSHKHNSLVTLGIQRRNSTTRGSEFIMYVNYPSELQNC